MNKLLTLVISISVLIIGIGFSYLNTQNVTVDCYICQYELPLSILLAITLAIGVTIGMLSSIFSVLRLTIVNKFLRSQIEEQEK